MRDIVTVIARAKKVTITITTKIRARKATTVMMIVEAKAAIDIIINTIINIIMMIKKSPKLNYKHPPN